MNEQPNFEVPANLMQALGDYLSTRPYREVAGLLHSMQACRQIEKPKDAGQ